MAIEASETTGPDAPASRLAAVVFDRDEQPDPPLLAFIEAATQRGARIAGLVQERACPDGLCALKDARVRDLVTGETLDIMQRPRPRRDELPGRSGRDCRSRPLARRSACRSSRPPCRQPFRKARIGGRRHAG